MKTKPTKTLFLSLIICLSLAIAPAPATAAAQTADRTVASVSLFNFWSNWWLTAGYLAWRGGW